MLPLVNDCDINILTDKIKTISNQYPKYYNMINQYFLDVKLKYFQDGSYNYNKFLKDIRSNSILERFNKIVKAALGVKQTCNWAIF